MARGRHAEEKIFHTEPTNTELSELLRGDQWIWVEGRVYVASYEEDKHLAADKAKAELTKLGLVLHSQKGSAAENAPRRRRWTTQRVDLQLATEILEEYPNGISLDDYVAALFDKTPDWTTAHQKATKAKTAVILHKLRGMGLATRSGRGLLFPTRKQSTTGLPPVLLAVVKEHLGPDYPDRSIRRLVKLILQASEAVALGKTMDAVRE